MAILECRMQHRGLYDKAVGIQKEKGFWNAGKQPSDLVLGVIDIKMHRRSIIAKLELVPLQAALAAVWTGLSTDKKGELGFWSCLLSFALSQLNGILKTLPSTTRSTGFDEANHLWAGKQAEMKR